MFDFARRLRDRVVTERDDAGFTVVEAVVAFIIFGFVATAATYSIINGHQASKSTQARITATNLAQQSIAQSRALSQSGLNNATTTTTVSGYSVARTVTFLTDGATATSCPTAIDPGHVHTMRVSVTVTPPAPSTRTVTMATVIACRRS